MQSKYQSLLESFSNTFIGYWINIAVQVFVYPMYGAVFTLQQNIELGLIFLSVSLIRGYIIRRYFNKKD